tara:strand:+ start:8704 stop:8856 length:153 start_codon:yes stop_codon:yes gene_type:complete
MLLEDRLDVVAGLTGVKATPDIKAGGWRLAAGDQGLFISRKMALTGVYLK